MPIDDWDIPTQPQAAVPQQTISLDDWLNGPVEIVAAPMADMLAQLQTTNTLFGGNSATASAYKRRYATPKPPPTPNARISDVYAYKSLAVNSTSCKAFEKQYKLINPPTNWVTPEGMVGIEIEVENITQQVMYSPHWNTHDDGSLRNHGIEYVSVPLAVRQIDIALESLYTELYKTNKPDFSNRTSIHIHLNCRDLTQDEIYTLVLLYAVFEKHFYGYAGTKRLNSIFCVPLYRCNILEQAKDVIYNFHPSWHKYCGINLLPLIDNGSERAKGTIEFRHLYGTNDLKNISEWINQILCLRKACKEIKLEEIMDLIKTMNTTSDYLALFYRVFNGPATVKNKQVFEESISNIKRELFQTDYLRKIQKSSDCLYWTLANKLGLKG